MSIIIGLTRHGCDRLRERIPAFAGLSFDQCRAEAAAMLERGMPFKAREGRFELLRCSHEASGIDCVFVTARHGAHDRGLEQRLIITVLTIEQARETYKNPGQLWHNGTQAKIRKCNKFNRRGINARDRERIRDGYRNAANEADEDDPTCQARR